MNVLGRFMKAGTLLEEFYSELAAVPFLTGFT